MFMLDLRIVVPRAAIWVCALLLFATWPVHAEQDSTDEWATEGRNELGPYLGFASASGDHGLSVGLDYERRLTRLFGVGVVLEYTDGDFRDGLAAISFDWHVWKELKIFAAPGIEVEREDGSSGALLRLGVDYGFPIAPRLEIVPAAAIDFSDENTTVVLGAVLAWKF